MALPPQFLDELRARTALMPLIQRKTRLAKSGRNWKGCCPFHGEKTPSFYVYDDHFHCFGCGAHGDAISFVMRAEGQSFPEAVERLAAEAGLDVPKPTPEAAARERRARDLYGVLEAAEAAYRRRLFLPEGAEGLAYLRRRGLSAETIARFGLGWSGPGRGGLLADLGSDGITSDQLLEAGLLREREDGSRGELFFNRVLFPIRDRRGRVISFGGRTLGDGVPKYVNGPETEIFSKRRNLYALDLAREGAFRGAVLVVVEGYMDVIALHQAGFEGAVAPLGTALTAEQMEEIWRITPEPVLCFDGDAAGARAAARSAELALPLLSTERTLSFARLPAGRDPDSMLATGQHTQLKSILDNAEQYESTIFNVIRGHIDEKSAFGRASFLKQIDEKCEKIGDTSLKFEMKRTLRGRFFELFANKKKKGKYAPQWPRPMLISAEAAYARSGALIMLALDDPELLNEFEEDFSSLPMREDQAAVRGSIQDWWAIKQNGTKQELMDHISGYGASGLVNTLIEEDRRYPIIERKYTADIPDSRSIWIHFRGISNVEIYKELLRQSINDYRSEKSSDKLVKIQNRIIFLREEIIRAFDA